MSASTPRRSKRPLLLAAAATAALISCTGDDGCGHGGSGGGGGHGGGAPDAAAPDGGTPPILAAVVAARKALESGATSIDLDGDGRAEWTLTRSNGAITHEEIDVDGDGVPDLIWDYSGTPQTFSVEPGGQQSELVEMTPDAPKPGVVTFRHTVFATDPAQPDTRETFTVDPSQPTVTVFLEQDTDHSGTFVDAGSTTTPFLQPSGNNLVSVDPAKSGCTPDQAMAIEQAFDDAVATGFDCLDAIDPVAAQEFAHMIASSGGSISVTCAGEGSGECAHANFFPWMGWRIFGIGSMGITVRPCAMGEPARFLFHELLHYVFGMHPFFGGTDRIYACEYHCFVSPQPNTQTCGECLGTSASDPRCSEFPPPPGKGGYHCPCNGTTYCTESACVAGCMTTLGCFSGICDPVSSGACTK